MSTPYAAKLAAYSSASAHGGVAAADPHRVIVMLMDGALERISTARGVRSSSRWARPIAAGPTPGWW